MIDDTEGKGGVDENLEHASWEKEANLFKKLHKILQGYLQTYLKVVQTIRQILQTYSILRKPKQQYLQS